MLTTLDSSPTGCSINAVLAQQEPSSTTSAATTAADQLLPSPTKLHMQQQQQDRSCAKRPTSSSSNKAKHRHHPYPADCSVVISACRSPGSCSSDGGESSKSDDDNATGECGNGSGGPRQPCKVKRIAANSRERKRMHTVNSAFDQLRELVPTYPSNRKLSKIDTLRLACTYIQDLVSLLHNSQGIQGEDVSTLYHQPFPDAFSGYPVSIKQEIAEFQPPPPFTATPEHFRMQPTACLRFTGHPDGCPESYPSSASESDSTTHSPPHQFLSQPTCPPPPPPPPPAASASVSSRPPPLTRVSSEGTTASIHRAMAEATISSSCCSSSCSVTPATNGGGAQSPPLMVSMSTCAQQQQAPPPPPPPSSSVFTTQRQVNITSPLAMHSVHHTSTSQNLLQNTLGHHSPPPIWQRPTPVPNGFALYGQ